MPATAIAEVETIPQPVLSTTGPLAPFLLAGYAAPLPAPHRRSRPGWLLPALIILLGIILRVAPIGHESLEGDEMFSRKVALLPMAPALEAIRNDLVHPPLYYLLLKAGVRTWGATPLGIRFMSLLFGIATMPLVATIGARLKGGRSAGWLAAAVIAVNQCSIFYSQQARSYSLYVFLVLLLIYWVTAVVRQPRPMWMFAAGSLLMIVMVYVHYIAAVYIGVVVMAVLLCRVALRTKVLTVAAAGLAALSFIPWLLTEVSVYRAKHGVGENLDWQGRPGLYQLKEVWASAIGIMSFRGATTLAFLLVILLSFAALKFSSRRHSFGSPPLMVALASAAFVPPLALFVLSIPPFSLPLWGLRQVLPSIVILGLLGCYGLHALARRVESNFIFVAGSSLLLLLAFVPTAQRMVHGPVRYPYQRIAEDLHSHASLQEPVYTTWFWGIGQTVNYYCAADCVQPLPTDYSGLPETIILLYRPNAAWEVQRYQELLSHGYAAGASREYDVYGKQPSLGTSMVFLTRRDNQAGGRINSSLPSPLP